MTTYVITGANRGIGYEYCRQIKDRGDEAIAVCRQSSDELDALGVQVIDGIDVTSDASVAKLCQQLGSRKIDVLVNNAAIAKQITLNKLDFDSIREQFEVNALGALRVTDALLPNLQAGSKIAMMTSRMRASLTWNRVRRRITRMKRSTRGRKHSLVHR